MQSKPHQLLRQQIVLEALGYYTGPLDGIWGPATIEAMRKFENRIALFRPAHQSGGLPFADAGPLPKGLYRTRDGLVCCDTVDPEPSAKELELRNVIDNAPRGRLSAKRPDVAANAAPVATEAAPAEATQEEISKISLDSTRQKHHGKGNNQPR